MSAVVISGGLIHYEAFGRGEPVVFDEGPDTAGPVAVAVVVEEPVADLQTDGDDEAGGDATSRLAVFGDSDFLTDVEIGNAGNLILGMNTLNWMTSRELSMGIPPRDVEDLSLYISQQKMRIIQVIVLLVMPGAAIAMGILVWRRRKH